MKGQDLRGSYAASCSEQRRYGKQEAGHDRISLDRPYANSLVVIGATRQVTD
ncbi:MAG TPA: hypothetical protein VKG80_01250 [Trebonia sp.]|nr:hypothetical protein [Trebonia sp.]